MTYCTTAVSKVINLDPVVNPPWCQWTKARNTVKLHKSLLTSAPVGRRWEKERQYGNMRRPHQLDKDKQHILVRKRRADTDYEFFPGSNMLIHWVVYKLRLPFGAPSKLGLINFRLLVFNSPSLPYHNCQLSKKKKKKKTMSHLLTSASTGSTHVHKILNPQVFFQLIFNYHKCFGLAIQRLSALFIYLLIYSNSYELFNYITISRTPLLDLGLKNISFL